MFCIEKYFIFLNCINDCSKYMQHIFFRKYFCQSCSIIVKHSKYLFKIAITTFNLNENTGTEHVMMFESKKTQKFIKEFF